MANEHLTRTPTSCGNRHVFTISFWTKNNVAGGHYFQQRENANSTTQFGISHRTPEDFLRVIMNDGSSVESLSDCLAEMRDFSSWQNIIVAVNTTIDLAEDRVKIYVDGVRRTEFNSDSHSDNPAQNFLTSVNDTVRALIGLQRPNSSATLNNSVTAQLTDYFLVDGQALTPDVFGFYKEGKGYQSSGTTQATDFRPGQWVPKAPRTIKTEINRKGGFGVNGFYMPMNDSSNFGADFHCDIDSIIKLKGEDLPQPRNGAPTTSDAYVSQLRTDPYAANLVLAVPGISTATGPNLITNGHFDSDVSGWTAVDATITWSNGRAQTNRTGGSGYTAYHAITGLVSGQRYTLSGTIDSTGTGNRQDIRVLDNLATSGGSMLGNISGTDDQVVQNSISFTATGTTHYLYFVSDSGGTGFFDNIVVKQEDAPRDYSADIKGSGSNRTPTVTGPVGVGYEIPSYYGSAINTTNAGDALYYNVDGSGSNAYGTGDFTFECWFYATEEPSNWGILMKHATNGSWANGITLTSKNNTSRQFTIYTQDGSSNVQTIGSLNYALNQWHHVVAERYNGQLTLYVNGVAEATRADTRNYAVAGTPASSEQYALSIGAQSGGNYQSNGYFQDVRVYKGVAKYKGGFDVPKPYTPVGIESWRQVSDTCKNNFATLNPIQTVRTTTTDGNLSWTTPSNTYVYGQGTIGIPTTGKWVFEGRFGSNTTTNNYNSIGVSISNPTAAPFSSSGRYGINDASSTFGQSFIQDGSRQGSITLPAGTIIQVLIDRDNNQMTFVKDGTLQTATGSTVTIPSDGVLYPMIGEYNVSGQINFGQNPSFSGQVTAGTYTDASGKGLFKYQPPAGYLALCEDNLPAPAIADPGEHFKTVLWTGVNDTVKIKCGFQPDFVWIKNRDYVNWHSLYDSIRGPYLELVSNDTSGDRDRSSNDGLRSFDSDGFTSGLDDNTGGKPGDSYVAWCWKAGGAAVSNSDGTITSQVSANQTVGFSIVKWTSNGNTSVTTMGHGLAKTPKFMLLKRTVAADNWFVYHESIQTNNRQYVQLNTTSATITSPNDFWSTSSSTFGIRQSSIAANGQDCIAYCWTEIEGYSKFGSYTGNNNADGSFVYCGFKPAWVMIKQTNDSNNWHIADSSRKSVNPVNMVLRANLSNAESANNTGFNIDFLSNGFKLRSTNDELNENNSTYIFAAFAESPFQTANAK